MANANGGGDGGGTINNYGVRYQSQFYPYGDGELVTIQILKKDYVGVIDELTYEWKSNSITVDPIDYFETMVATSIELNIVNDKVNYFELEELFTANDFEYMVKIFGEEFIYFQGFIPCNIVSQKYLPWGIINLNATNNIKRLSEFKPTLFTTKGGYSLIEIIRNCLQQTGLNLPIYVNNTMFDIGMPLLYNPLYDSSWIGDVDSFTVFDASFVSSDLFFDGNEYQDCKTILEKILTAAESKVYYWDGIWYIERLKDMGKSTKTFARYLPNGQVNWVTGTNPPYEIGTDENSDVVFTGMTQTTNYVPGKKKIKVTLNESVDLNLTNYYYSDVTASTKAIETIYQDLNLKKWTVDQYTTHSIFTNRYKINNGIKLYNTRKMSDAAINPPFDDIYAILQVFTGSVQKNQYRLSYSGLYTSFRFTLNPLDDEGVPIQDTIINFSMKFALPDDFLENEITFTNQYLSSPENLTFFMRIFVHLKNKGKDTFVVKGTDGKWSSTNDTWFETPPSTDYASAIIEVPVKFSEFTNPSKFSTEVSVEINVDDFRSFFDNIGYDAQDKDVVYGDLYICEIGYYAPEYNEPANIPHVTLKTMIIGDLKLTVNNALTDNVHIGSISEGFIEDHEVELDLYDSTNYNLVNGIYLDRPLFYPTYGIWSDDSFDSVSSIIIKPLYKRIIEDRYQVYHKNRIKLVTDFHFYATFRPFIPIYDPERDLTFILTGFQLMMEELIYKNAVLLEYVDDDGVS